ncbi:MAG: hypothetical protein H6907_00470 [Hyphomicrobiales bacterium]|nr:hypothetical protein [Hyphomicrobiales bacterium]MCP5370184.1 hypothetical protein [Hyphomicrobiales bacterium]
MTRHTATLPTLVLALAAAAAAPAAAQQPLIDNFGDWSAFGGAEGEPTCYAASLPKKETGEYDKRGDTYVMVVHRPKSGEVGVVTVRAGYTYKKDSKVAFTVDGETVEMFTDVDHAWAFDDKADKRLVQMMRAGRELVVSGTSWRGTETKDSYSLSGFTAAYTAISKKCGVN